MLRIWSRSRREDPAAEIRRPLLQELTKRRRQPVRQRGHRMPRSKARSRQSRVLTAARKFSWRAVPRYACLRIDCHALVLKRIRRHPKAEAIRELGPVGALGRLGYWHMHINRALTIPSTVILDFLISYRNMTLHYACAFRCWIAVDCSVVDDDADW